METLKIALDKFAILPTRAHGTDAGLDLYSPVDFTLGPGDALAVNTGVHVAIEPGFYGAVKGRSGLAIYTHIEAFNGTIDAEYRGAITVKLRNFGLTPLEFKRGDRIAQLVIIPCALPEVVVVDKLDETQRGSNGFGSTGR